MKHSRFIFTFLGFSIFLGLFFQNITTTFSQALPINTTTNSEHKVFVIQTTPETPGAYEQVKATLVSYEIDLKTLPITWKINGKKQTNGIGLKDFSFKTGPAGTTIALSAEVTTPSSDYGTIIQEKSFSPQNLDTLWEADTYTPPFYKGKALPTAQSTIKVVAYPSFFSKGKAVNPNSLVYTWKNGYFIDQTNSGYGKRTYVYVGGYPGNTDSLTTTVSSIDKTLSIDKTTRILISTPKVLLYEDKPLGGVSYENQISNTYYFPKKQVTIHAEPFFFSFPYRNQNNGEFRWVLGGKTLTPNPDNKTEFVIQTPDEGRGNINLSLSVINKDHRIQSAQKQTTLIYNNQ